MTHLAIYPTPAHARVAMVEFIRTHSTFKLHAGEMRVWHKDDTDIGVHYIAQENVPEALMGRSYSSIYVHPECLLTGAQVNAINMRVHTQRPRLVSVQEQQ